jgi:rhodanese-related sulfurtransferase
MFTITREELKRMIDKRESFTLIDVRSPERYIEEHLPRAVNIPLDEIERGGLYDLNREDIIVVYSKGDNDSLSLRAVSKLTKLECRRVYELVGGIKDWSEGGYPVESSLYARAVGE